MNNSNIKNKIFTIGTRGSKLALWQAEFVRATLSAIHPNIAVVVKTIKTFGDAVQNVSLTEIGGRGVFTKELETALLEKQIDLAVHSLKDLPTILPESLQLAAVMKREDTRDALILRQDLNNNLTSIKDLPQNAVIGTSSLRRASQLKHWRPDLQIKDVRGNVDTRLKKLDACDYDAILLAVAGLKRLNFESRISVHLDLEEMLPQVGQGALGIETRKDDAETNDFVASLNHVETALAVAAERAFLRGLGGGCQFPIAAYAKIENDLLNLKGLVATPDGAQILRDKLVGKKESAVQLGEQLAQNLLAQGAQDLIDLKLNAAVSS